MIFCRVIRVLSVSTRQKLKIKIFYIFRIGTGYNYIIHTYKTKYFSAKAEKSQKVYLPKLTFGERRQFASVIDDAVSLLQYMADLVWSRIVSHIPASYMDGPFDVPHPVTDKRHQDAVIEYVQDIILNREVPREIEEVILKGDIKGKPKKTVETIKHEITLTGDQIICGTGRIIAFDSVGEKPTDVGEIIVLIATAGLPAPDDLPIVFINIGQLTDIPFKALAKLNITEIYIQWTLNGEEHKSEPQRLKAKETVDFNDHHAVILSLNTGSDIISRFIDMNYRIQIRGIRSLPPSNTKPNFFGYAKGDRDYPSSISHKLPNLETDILIGTTKIDTRNLTSRVNEFLRGDFPIYPLEVTVEELERDRICTNDLNGVRAPLIPEIIVPTGVILEAQMTLEVSIGVVGCKLHRKSPRYSRLFDLVNDTAIIMTILNQITKINQEILESGNRDDLLSGFALDTGNTVMLYVEGPRDRQILHVWEISADYYPDMKPIFSSSAKYRTRLYPEFIKGAVPFVIMKMFVPLSVLLACPPIYARPALPLLTRHAVLKLGRLLTCKQTDMPDTSEMPTTAELGSFRLEFCVAPRPPPVSIPIVNRHKDQGQECSKNATVRSKINWEV